SGGTMGPSGGAGGTGTPALMGGAAGVPIMPPIGGGGTGSGGTPASTGGGGGAPPIGAAMPSSGCGMANVPPTGNKTIDVNGTQRQFVVTVPAGYDPSKPYRLIFAWHGLGGTAM